MSGAKVNSLFVWSQSAAERRNRARSLLLQASVFKERKKAAGVVILPWSPLQKVSGTAHHSAEIFAAMLSLLRNGGTENRDKGDK